MIDMEKIYQRVFANQVTDDPTFDMVLFAIFAFAAHHVPSLHGTELVNSTAGDYYANCAMTMVKSLFNVNKIRTVQVLVLLAWRSQGCGQDEDAWLYTGELVAYRDNLNNRPPRANGPSMRTPSWRFWRFAHV